MAIKILLPSDSICHLWLNSVAENQSDLSLWIYWLWDFDYFRCSLFCTSILWTSVFYKIAHFPWNENQKYSKYRKFTIFVNFNCVFLETVILDDDHSGSVPHYYICRILISRWELCSKSKYFFFNFEQFFLWKILLILELKFFNKILLKESE